jgi:hypothetical protein
LLEPLELLEPPELFEPLELPLDDDELEECFFDECFVGSPLASASACFFKD